MWHGRPLATLLAVLGFTAVSGALAQTARPSPAFQATDTNRDGQVDRAEYHSHVRDAFSSLDRDNDGILTGSELPDVTAETIRAADGDSDGKLTAIEYMNQRLKEF
jgi:hypothetical protein